MASTAAALAAAMAAIALVGGAAIYITAADVPGLSPQAAGPRGAPAEPAVPAPAATAQPPQDAPAPTDPPAAPPERNPDAPAPPGREPGTATRPAAPAPPEGGAGLVMLGSFGEYAEFLSMYDRPYAVPYMARELQPMAEFSAFESDVLMQSGVADAPEASPAMAASPAPPGAKHSTTNVQVAGVDEPDFVKNDGRHIYALKHNRLAIVDTQNPDPARAVTMVELDIPPLVRKHDMLVNGDRLVVLYYVAKYNQAGGIDDYATHAMVLDISDRSGPELVREHTVPGRLETGRMVGGHAYVIASKAPDYADPALPALLLDGETAQETPVYRPEGEDPFPDSPPHLVTVMAIDIHGGAASSVAFLMDPRGTTYMSRESLYLTAAPQGRSEWAAFHVVSQLLGELIALLDEPHRAALAAELAAVREGDEGAVVSLLASVLAAYVDSPGGTRASLDVAATQALSKVAEDLGLATEATEIYRIGVDGTSFEIAARGTVPGRMLNQFSMDEHGGALRVATTVSGRLSTFNNVFMLDASLRATGALTGIAPDESSYSARFVGDRLYLVTFRQIDPFFVIDLSGEDPVVLGELKMPGYSDYLHFYDESTVIGIGREEGLKIAMFDITDIKRPRLADSIVMGSWGTHSPAERDHKALLVSREHGIMSIPVASGADLGLPVEPFGGTLEDARAGTFVFLVYGIGPRGFDLEQTIGHELRHGTDTRFARSLYIGESLYTVSESALTRSPIDGPDYVTRVPLALGERAGR
ncbi:MAG: beta-propeller domain-containing protein [Thaumarchaeota archaeon]|nr:beta-propeller domain-containing protein [Nitrososphaerota archaeon]